MIRVLIRKKGDRNKLVMYFIEPTTGKEVCKTTGTRDRKEAERAAALWEQELLNYRGPANDGWDYFRTRFEDEHVATKSPKTRHSYGTALNRLRDFTKVKRVSEINTDVLSRFQAAMLGKKLAVPTVRSYLRCIKAALRWAEYVGIIDRAPMVKLPMMPTRRFMKGRPITEPEYRKMLATCSELYGDDAGRWQRFLTLLWLSGLRLEEATRLSWETPPILINLEASPYPLMIIHAEGQKSRQDECVPLPPDLAAWLRMTPERDRNGLVAPLPQLNTTNTGREISRIGEAAKIKVNDAGKFASAHDFRRSFGTRWAMKVKPLTLQRLMRHAAIETTLRYYVGLSSDDAGADMYGDAGNGRGKMAG